MGDDVNPPQLELPQQQSDNPAALPDTNAQEAELNAAFGTKPDPTNIPGAGSTEERLPKSEETAPPATDKHDDATDQITAKNEDEEHKAKVEELNNAFATPSNTSTTGPLTPEKPVSDKKDKHRGFFLDVFKGVTAETGNGIVGGTLDAIDATGHLLDEVQRFAAKALPAGIPVAYHEGKFYDAEEYAAFREQNPRDLGKLVSEPTTVTGGLIRGMSQFVAGFQAAGAIGKAAGIANATTTVGTAVQGLAKSGLATFAAVEGHSQNLANLVEEHSDLLAPVAHILASHSDDPELLGRLKNVMADAIPGALLEGVAPLVKAFANGVRAQRNATWLYNLARMLSKHTGEEELRLLKIQPFETLTLGDPSKPLVAVKPTGPILPTGDTVDRTALAVGKKAKYEFNFASINGPDDVQKALELAGKEETKNIAEAKRGVVSWDETRQASKEADGYRLILGRTPGEVLNDAQITAVREFRAATATKLQEMARLAAEQPTPMNQLNFEKMLKLNAMANAETAGAKAELGRGLNALKIRVSGEDFADQVERALVDSGGHSTSLDVANKLTKLERSSWSYFAEEVGKMTKKTGDAVAQAYVNGLFTPATITVKAVSDFANAVKAIGDRAVAARISEKMGTEGGVEMGEALAMGHGMISAIKEALYATAIEAKGAKSFSEFMTSPGRAVEKMMGQEVNGMIKFEMPQGGKIAAQNWNISSSSPMGKALDTIDKTTAIPARAIGVVDQFSKMMGYRMEKNALALRTASQELAAGKIGVENFEKRIAEVLADNSGPIHLAAIDQANFMTFTSKPPEALSRLGNAIQNFPIIGRVLLPFKNVPANILTQTLEGTPFAPLLQSFRADVAAGGARANMALARLSTGNAMSMAFMDLAYKGLITGKGPENPAERAIWLQTHQPGSVKIPGGWLALERLGTIGSHLYISAVIAEAVTNAEKDIEDKDFTKVMTGLSLSITSNVMSKTYMMGTAEFMNAVTNPEHKGENYFKHLVGSTIPGPIATLTRTIDPLAHAADTMADGLRRRIPLLSKDLPTVPNIWGEDKSYRSPMGALYDAFSPFWVMSNHPQPINDELTKLNYFPSMPEHRLNANGVELPLNGHQYEKYVKLAGNEFKDQGRGNLGCKDYLNAVVTGKSPMSAVYEDKKQRDKQFGTDEAKVFIRSEIESYRQQAAQRILHEDKTLWTDRDEKTKKNPSRIPSRVLYSN